MVEQIDTKAIVQFGSRSDFLRIAALQYLKKATEWENIFYDEVGDGDTYLAEWNAFLTSIKTSSQPLVGVKDGISTLQVILAAKKSNSNNKKVSIDNLL